MRARVQVNTYITLQDAGKLPLVNFAEKHVNLFTLYVQTRTFAWSRLPHPAPPYIIGGRVGGGMALIHHGGRRKLLKKKKTKESP